MSSNARPHVVRVTTVPISLHLLLTDQPRYLHKNGFDVTLCSSDGPEVALVEASQGVPHCIVPMTRRMTPIRDLVSIARMYLLLARLKPDIVHSHTPKAGLVAMLASRLAGIPLRIHTVAGFRADTLTGLRHRLMLLMEKVTYAASTNVWPNSRSLHKKLLNYGLCSETKMEVVGAGSSNGIDLSYYSPDHIDPEMLTKVKARVSYNHEVCYLLFVGRIVKDKGIEELVEAFVRCKADHPALELILVGPVESDLDPVNEPTRTAIDTRADIHNMGYSDEVKYFMAIADLFVFPSHREGFPNVLLQAGAMGCPIICSDIGGNVDLVKDRVTGVVHKVCDDENLRLAVDYALANLDAMSKMADRLQEEIRTKFERSVVQQGIVARYRQLLSLA